MMLARTVLLLAAAMFATFGVWLVFDPARLDVWLGIRALRPEGNTELRAFYGGLEVGLAAFLIAAAMRTGWQAPALFALMAINGGIAAARVYGFAIDGSFSGKLLSFLVVEVGLTVASGFALVRLPSNG